MQFDNNQIDWVKNFEGAVTIANTDLIIVYMNEKAIQTWAKYGGISLVGKSLIDCHKNASIDTIHEIMKTKKPNTYTILKNGIKKLIYQTPWIEENILKGIIEISLEIPLDMPHFVRS